MMGQGNFNHGPNVPRFDDLSITPWGIAARHGKIEFRFFYTPSPSMSAFLIISSTSSLVSFLPKLVITCLSPAAEMKSLLSLSNTRKSSRISSSLSGAAWPDPQNKRPIKAIEANLFIILKLPQKIYVYIFTRSNSKLAVKKKTFLGICCKFSLLKIS